MNDKQGPVLRFGKHSQKKHRILREYLVPCEAFQQKYGNFVYIDAHGGSGRWFLNSSLIEGSPLIAANAWEKDTFPCHVIELHPRRFRMLQEFTEDNENITLYNNDCNKQVPEIVSKLQNWKFGLCFFDPAKLKYDAEGIICHQLLWKTIKKISKYKKKYKHGKGPAIELFINFPVQAITRLIGTYKTNPEYEGIKWLNGFFGDEGWKTIGNDKTELAKYYMGKLNAIGYKYTGAILIRRSSSSPIYYLIFATSHDVGMKIMKHGMKKEFLGDQKSMKKYPDSNFIFE